MRGVLALGIAVVPALLVASAAGHGTVYPLHLDVTATVFWIGEPRGGGSSEDNAISAWDDAWLQHYGGVDDPSLRTRANGYFPRAFAPKENPFYIDLPFNDFDDSGAPRADRFAVVPWANEYGAVLGTRAVKGRSFSLLKNRWVKLIRGGRVCYAQWEDSGPYVYDDARYVFGTRNERPRNRRAGGAGIDVSPAVRDCLGFRGLNNAVNRLAWQFVEAADVPAGPWTRVVTTRQVYWP